jgi:oxygen-independent coproporphyrinogen III oxidase
MIDTVGTAELLARYDRPGPRYTSYPTALEFGTDFGEAELAERLAAANRDSAAPLSLYAHLPFCQERCLYCGCNVVITQRRDVADRYLDALIREIELLAARLPDRRRVAQLHWGGGTPTYFAEADLERLFRAFERHFTFTPDAEIAIEVDPRVTTERQIALLRRLGFHRLSFGVQDFDPKVQETVGRIQTYEQTRALVERARAEGFRSINVDLIYGLPHQSLAGFGRTMEQVLAIRPERVAVYSFAYVPWIKPHMKKLPAEALPKGADKLGLFGLAVDSFLGAGYRQIGMDHFAVPEDELALAIEERRLHRNFMGYTVQAATDMLGLGITAIGDVQGAFVQNARKLPDYYAAIEAGRLPVERGIALDRDDLIRRDVITRLMCNFHLDVREIERAHDIVFTDYFAESLVSLAGPDSPVAHDLLTMSPQALDVTARGRLFIRNVCMAFDRYLPAHASAARPSFSRTV